MPENRNSRFPVPGLLALLLLIAACTFFIGLGRLPLLEPDEGRNAEVAREMLVTHDFVTPHFDALPYLDKPAFQFWLIAGAFRAFGISEWAARFPSALLALACVLLAWVMSRSMEEPGPGAGFRAGIILAVSPLFFVFARTVIFDMTLTLFVVLALYCFWLNDGREPRSRGLDVLAFVFMGVATLTKGPVGFLIPLITLVVYCVLSGRTRRLRKVHWSAGWIVFLAVVLPWFIAVSVHNPDFPRYALWKESLLRFTTGARMHRAQSVFYYVPVYLGGFFPWSFFLLGVAWVRRKSWRRLRAPECRAPLFLLVWAGVVFVFFSISHSKLPAYFLPAIVPLSVLAGILWREAGRPSASSAHKLPGWMSAGYGITILAGLAMVATSLLLHRHAFVAHLRMPPSVAGMLPSALFSGGVIVAALAFLSRNFASRPRGAGFQALSFAVIAFTLPLLVIRWIAPLKRYYAVDSSRQLAHLILESPDRDLPIYGFYYFRTSLPFYLRRPVGLVSTDGDEITSNYVIAHYRAWLGGKPPAAEITPANDASGLGSSRFPLLMDGAQFTRFAHSPGPPFLLMVRNNEVNLALENAGRLDARWEAWKYAVWRRPAR